MQVTCIWLLLPFVLLLIIMEKSKIILIIVIILAIGTFLLLKNNNQEYQEYTKEAKEIKEKVEIATTTENIENKIPEFSLAEVQAGNSEIKCLTIVNNEVYDVTSFIDKHPGGRKRILKMCGRDASADFSEQHAESMRALKMLESLKIGVLKK